MPSITAKRQCPDLIFVKPRFDAYKAVSLQIRGIFAEHTPIIEPLSLDEAYLDVTENLQGIATATEIAEQIRAKVLAETSLTASAGVSYNKFLAKLASDHRKPDGLFVITPKMGPAFVPRNLLVGKFRGVRTGHDGEDEPSWVRRQSLDLRAQTLPFLQQHFGKSGCYYYWIARGIDDHGRSGANRVTQVYRCREHIMPMISTAREAAQSAIVPIIDKVWRHCETAGTRGRTVTLKIKFADFQQITRSQSPGGKIEERMVLERICMELLRAQFPVAKGIRLLGVSISAFDRNDAVDSEQLPLGI